ncbi:MAG TPA: hypothetical protein VN428_09575 [Bryobacteraceae bacterium]|nr:hypothetical protein [Bryobacteraceae bacterium]
MSVPLELVASAAHIRDSVRTFNELPPNYDSLARSMLSGSTYWVYDPDTEAFGPAKFVGFRAISAEDYELARAGDSTGTRFDGHVTRTAIERVLGCSFRPDPALADQLNEWAGDILGTSADDVFSNVDQSKWSFVSLPSGDEAQQTQYVASWKYDTYQSLAKGVPFDHAGSDHFDRVTPGDTVWVVTIKQQRLFLVARIVVGAVLDKEQAKRRWPRVWDAEYHVGAVQGTAEPLRKLDITHLIPDLRFEGGSPHLPRDFRQSFRSLRRLHRDSGELFRLAWAETQDGQAPLRETGLSEVDAAIRVSFEALIIGEQYDRPELADIWGYRDWHALGRGCVTPSKHPYIILFITREKQEALTQYEDHFDGDRLYIQGETNHAADARIVGARENGDEIHLFYRDTHHSPFTYFGPIELVEDELRTDVPSRFVFATHRTEALVESVLRADDRAHGVVDNAEPDAEGRRRLVDSPTKRIAISVGGDSAIDANEFAGIVAGTGSPVEISGSPDDGSGNSTIMHRRRRSPGDVLGQEYHAADEQAAVAERELFPVDPELIERGVRGHATTQNRLAEHLRSSDLEPRSSRSDEPNFDIAWTSGGQLFVGEVKSITENNEEKQLRLGLGQVLRYAHQLRGGEQTVPVLIVERRPSDPGWEDLCSSLNVVLVWPDIFGERLTRERGPSTAAGV